MREVIQWEGPGYYAWRDFSTVGIRLYQHYYGIDFKYIGTPFVSVECVVFTECPAMLVVEERKLNFYVLPETIFEYLNMWADNDELELPYDLQFLVNATAESVEDNYELDCFLHAGIGTLLDSVVTNKEWE